METTPSSGRRHQKAHGPLTISGVGGHGLLFPVPARRPTNRVPSAAQQPPGRCERSERLVGSRRRLFPE
jgi:hypothetical protein